MGLAFTVLTAEIDETKFETEDPVESVCRICAAKARAVAASLQGSGIKDQGSGTRPADPCRDGTLPSAQTLILTADTIVVLDGRIMGKPHDAAEARAMLTALSGREHAVYTAFCLLPVGIQDAEGRRQNEGLARSGAQGAPPITHVEKTLVKFRELTPAEIAAYVATGEPMDKAGAYGIQNLGAMLVESIRGDYFTVMGLPVCQLALALKQFGIDPLAADRERNV